MRDLRSIPSEINFGSGKYDFTVINQDVTRLANDYTRYISDFTIRVDDDKSEIVEHGEGLCEYVKRFF